MVMIDLTLLIIRIRNLNSKIAAVVIVVGVLK